MSNSSGVSPHRRPAPLSVRFNRSELESLRQRAGNRPLSSYVKQAALGEACVQTRRNAPAPHVDRVLLAQALAQLGRSRLSNNLNQLAKAVHAGILPVNDFTEADIRSACADVRAMRRLLLLALGLKVEVSSEGLSAEFGKQSGTMPPTSAAMREERR